MLPISSASALPVARNTAVNDANDDAIAPMEEPESPDLHEGDAAGKKAMEAFQAIVAAFTNHWGRDWNNFYLRARHLDAAQKTALLGAVAHPNDLLLNSRPPSDADAEKLGAVIQGLEGRQLQWLNGKFDAASQAKTRAARRPAGMTGPRPPTAALHIPRKPPPLTPNRVLWNETVRPVIGNALALRAGSAASTPQLPLHQQPESGTILDKFYACAAYMSTDEKTQAIRDILELSSGEWLPRPSKIDVEKFRAVAIDLNQDQRQSLRDWYSKVASFGVRGRRMQYQALLCQIFDQFPILELNTATKGAVSITEGQTFFTPGLLDALKFKKASDRH